MQVFGKEISKIDRYSWAQKEEWPGKFAFVELSALHVDTSYQRGKQSEINILATARQFDWIAFGCPVVMSRDNGKLYVVDGQQRVAAAKRRGDITHVPCIVFKSPSSEIEAKEFLYINTHRKNVRAANKFRAAVVAGIRPQKDIHEWLAEIGLKVTNEPGVHCVEFAHVLCELWTLDEISCREAILLQRDISPSENLNGFIHRGLWWLLHNKVDVDKHVDRISRAGGKSAMLQAIRRRAIELGKSQSSSICGRGILDLINNKLRKKIIVSSE